MIIYLLFQAVFYLVNFLLDLVPLPDVPDVLAEYYLLFYDTVSSSLNLLALFVPMDLVRILLPVFIAVYNWKFMYSVLTWIFRKIPILGFK